MNKHQKFWDIKHFEKSELVKINRPSVFVKWSSKFFPMGARILELGAGIGQDTRYLIDHDFKIVATDFSKKALEYNYKTANSENRNLLTIQQLDISNSFPFKDQSFDVVYAHLVVHYFNNKITQQIFDEIYRVLKRNGIVAVLVNSINDPEYGLGKKLEDDYYEILSGRPKRFFTVDSLKHFIGKFHILVLDNKGSDPRRNHKRSLIRFIGKRG